MWPFRTSISFVEMDFRTDVHSHVLPGVDDGFKSIDRSVEAQELLHGLGLEHQFLTPHIYPDLYPGNSPESVRAVFSKYRERLGATGVESRVAGEHMVYGDIDREFTEDSISRSLQLNQGYVLVEMSYAYESQNIRDFVFHLCNLGLHPVLAHPERYNYYSTELAELKSIADIDTVFQLNILSLGGFYGTMAKLKAERILEQGLYSFLGTDLHSVSQIAQLKSLKIRKKHVPAVEKLLENNDLLWSGSFKGGGSDYVNHPLKKTAASGSGTDSGLSKPQFRRSEPLFLPVSSVHTPLLSCL